MLNLHKNGHILKISMVKLRQDANKFSLNSIFKDFFFFFEDFIWSFCHVGYIRIIPPSLFIMDRPLTDLEAIEGTYKFRSYGGEHLDRQLG